MVLFLQHNMKVEWKEKGIELTALLILYLAMVGTEAQYLDVSDIRLVGGSGRYDGRVELNINGVWGTVCDDDFDLNDAEVMCRMLGLRATAFLASGQYGEGFGPIYAQRFHCSGYESSLSFCSFVPNAQCTHTRDVGIICTECGEINYVNGRINISADGKKATTRCKEGLTAQYTEAVCANTTWSVPTLACSSLSITDIRLVNGVGITDGRVEILVNGTWGTICGISFDYEESYAVCRMLGFPGYYTFWTSSYAYGEGTGPVYLANLVCTYSDTNINDCTYNVIHTCTHSGDVAVACYTGLLNITDVRLSNGTGKYDGRVELFVNGVWGTICHQEDYYYLYGLGYAETICKMMNLSMSAVFTTPVYGPGSGPILITYLSCSNAYNHINFCSYGTPFYGHNHGYDLTLACSPCGRPENIVEHTIVINGTQLRANCFPGFSPSTITMTCKEDGHWDKQCQQIDEYPVEIRNLYLTDTYGYSWPSEGLVRILVNETWGGICGNNFDSRAAIVICRMLNLEYLSYAQNDPFIRWNTEFGRDKVPMFIDNLLCIGNESHINECTYNTGNNCTYWNDVTVSCTGYQLNITDIRLAGTNSTYAGRVEVLDNGTWGTVCQNYFDWKEADVVCRTMGFGCSDYRRYYTYYYNAYYGPGTGPIYVDRFSCPYYGDFSQCKYVANNYYSCSHYSDVSVVCYGPKLNITEARLVNGSDLNDGRAEILVNGVWGTICDQNFDILAADLFCQIRNLRALKYYTGATNGPGTGPVYIEQIFCYTYNTKLSDCDYLHLNTCSHDRDISVVCSACGQPDLSSWDVDYFQYNGTELFADCSYYKTYVGILKMKCNNVTGKWFVEGQCREYSYPIVVEDVRLAGGNNASSGRIEIKSLGTWGTVCNDSFGMSEAETVCRMIGYPRPAISYSTGLFGKGSGPIFVDDLRCNNTSIHINNCTYTTRDNCQHTKDVAVTCTDCGSPLPTNGFTNSTSSNVGSVVKTSCAGGYRLEGDSVLTCQASGKWSPSPPSCVLIGNCGFEVIKLKYKS